MAAKLKIRTCNVQGRSAFGITNGKMWFAYAYRTSEQAEKIVANLDTPGKIRVNISRPAPLTFVDLDVGSDSDRRKL